MFPPLELGGEQLVLRPANCPHHALVYAARQHSYRDLPVRLNELAPMFRAERSGVVGGLGRARPGPPLQALHDAETDAHHVGVVVQRHGLGGQ